MLEYSALAGRRIGPTLRVEVALLGTRVATRMGYLDYHLRSEGYRATDHSLNP